MWRWNYLNPSLEGGRVPKPSDCPIKTCLKILPCFCHKFMLRHVTYRHSHLFVTHWVRNGLSVSGNNHILYFSSTLLSFKAWSPSSEAVGSQWGNSPDPSSPPIDLDLSGAKLSASLLHILYHITYFWDYWSSSNGANKFLREPTCLSWPSSLIHLPKWWTLPSTWRELQ